LLEATLAESRPRRDPRYVSVVLCRIDNASRVVRGSQLTVSVLELEELIGDRACPELNRRRLQSGIVLNRVDCTIAERLCL
jgi:hypothetical protein